MQFDWNAAKDALRATLPQMQYNNWLSPVEFIRCDNHAVVLGVPSRFHEDWLRSHFNNALTTAIRKQCGNEQQLEFEILSSSKDDNPEAALEDVSFTPVPAPPPSAVRPSLRIIENEAAPPVDFEQSLQTAPSNLPSFNNPFLEMEYNHVTTRLAELFAVGNELNFNPLVIYAGIGMGKTHLLTHIGQRIHEIRPNARVRYTNFESFSSEFINALRSDNPHALIHFKKKYREHTDILLFDDLHGLEKRLKTQEELVHIFNEIAARGGKIAFSSSVAPHRLENFVEPLKSRVLSGVIGEIKYPTHQERISILKKIGDYYSIAIDDPVMSSLADQGHKDIRQLIGTMMRMHLQAKLENRPLDHQFLMQKGWTQEPKREAITLEEIVSLVEHNFGASRTELMSKSRKGAINWARQVTMYLARHYTLLSLGEIGKKFGRDHATVSHAFKIVEIKLGKSITHRHEVEFIKQKLHARCPQQVCPSFNQIH